MSLLTQHFVAPDFDPMQEYKGPLPQREGPKLEPFHDLTASITFRRLLSDRDSEGHAHVFEATIGSTAYALKLVSVKFPTKASTSTLKLLMS